MCLRTKIHRCIICMSTTSLVSNFVTCVCRDRNGRILDNGVHKVRRLSRKTWDPLVFDNFFSLRNRGSWFHDASLDWLSIWSPHSGVNEVSQCLSSPLKSTTTTAAIWVWKCLNRCWLGLHVLPSSSWWSFSISPSLRTPARYENQNGWYTFLLLCIPSLTLWFIVVCNDNVITCVPSVWGLYVWLALVPITGVKAKRICSLIWPGYLEDDPLPNSAPCCCLTHLKRKVKTESSYFSWPSK